MAAIVKTFGGAISEARKAKGWALKDLASRVLREDKEAISPQYLNDIEHDRRSPSSDCKSAWNKDPVFGVIGIQSGPRG